MNKNLTQEKKLKDDFIGGPPIYYVIKIYPYLKPPQSFLKGCDVKLTLLRENPPVKIMAREVVSGVIVELEIKVEFIVVEVVVVLGMVVVAIVMVVVDCDDDADERVRPVLTKY